MCTRTDTAYIQDALTGLAGCVVSHLLALRRPAVHLARMSDSDPNARLNAGLEGRYRIESELGEGWVATVYLADDLKHERKVALEVPGREASR